MSLLLKSCIKKQHFSNNLEISFYLDTIYIIWSSLQLSLFNTKNANVRNSCIKYACTGVIYARCIYARNIYTKDTFVKNALLEILIFKMIILTVLLLKLPRVLILKNFELELFVSVVLVLLKT